MNVISKLHRLLSRPDFQQSPLRAIGKRIYWRYRWASTHKPWLLPLDSGVSILTSRTGAGALIYYQGRSEPETSRFITEYLKPGMVFFDIGAHIGEFTLQASKLVGPSGQVHAFEPQADLVKLLKQSLALNGVRNVTINECALGESNGNLPFSVRAEASCSSLGNAAGYGDLRIVRTESVPVRTLESYCEEHNVKPDLVKVDVEGAEFAVLRGATSLLAEPPRTAPVWIVEYSPDNLARFGVVPDQLNALLDGFDCELRELHGGPRRQGLSFRNVVISKC